MYRLPTKEYKRVIPLLNSVPYNTLVAQMVVESKVQGSVFVDNILNPQACLVVHKYGMCFLIGETSDPFFLERLSQFVSNGAFEGSLAQWMLVYPESFWETTLATMLGEGLVQLKDSDDPRLFQCAGKRVVLQTERVNFRFNQDAFSPEIHLPEGFELKFIDEDLYTNITGSVVPLNFWDNAKDFVERSVGFSLIWKGKVVSTCFASFTTENQLELGVETSVEFQRMGHAVHPTTALLNYCLDKGYEPLWSCRTGNTGSFKLAQKVGFMPATYHPYFGLPVSHTGN